MNARQRRQARRQAIRGARAALPAWQKAVRACRNGWRAIVNGLPVDTGPFRLGTIEVARGPGLLVEATDRGGEAAIYVLRTYRVDGEERYEVLHREPPVTDCPDCA